MSLLRFFPTGILTKFAVFALVFLLGLAYGNSYATKAALQREFDNSARRMASNHEQLITWYAERMKALRLERAKQADADAAAYAMMQRDKARTDRALALARADLQKLSTATQQKLAEVRNETAHDPAPNAGCILPPVLRQSLNGVIDSINSHPNAGYTEADPARLPDGTNSAIAPVTCLELIGSLTDVLEHDAMLTGWVLSWQQWANEALR